MADGFIRVAPDSTGKELQTFENLVSGEQVHAEAVVLVDEFGVPLSESSSNHPIVSAIINSDSSSVIVEQPLGANLHVLVDAFGSAFGIGKIKNDPSADLDGGVPAMAIRQATPSNLSDTDGDYEMLQMDGGKLWVKGPLTDDELRATPVPISGSFSLPTGAATEAKQDAEIATLGVTTGAAVTSDADGTLQQYLRGIVKLNAASLIPTVQSIDQRTGGLTDAVPATDTASSALNGRLQRIAQRLTSLIVLLPASLGQKTMANSLAVTIASDQSAVPVSGTVTTGGLTDTQLRASAVPVSAASLPLPAGAATSALQTQPGVDIGDVTVNNAAGAAAVNIQDGGNSITVDGPLTDTQLRATAVPVSGPLTDTQLRATAVPVSTAALPLPSGASTAAKQPALGTALAPSTDVLTTQRPAVTQVVSTVFEASKVLKSSAGQLVQLSIFNSGAAQFILLINATSLPANGAVTLLYPPIPIAAATLLVLDLPAPLVASTGIVVCNSSTGSFTKTIGAADCAFYAQVN